MTITILSGTLGLNTNVDPAAMPRAESGQAYLLSCNNVFAGDTGRVNRCPGSEKLWDGPVHSVIAHGSRLMFCSGAQILEVLNRSSIVTVCALGSANKLAHVTLHDGLKNVTFLTDGIGHWKLSGSTVRPHTASVYLGPDTTIANSLTAPPPGSLLAYGLGRLLVAQGNHVYLSRPNAPSLFHLGAGRLTFEDEVTCIACVKGGIWVGTSRDIFYVASDGTNFERAQKAPYGAYKGVPPSCPADMTPMQNASGMGFIIPTQRGFVFAGQDGFFSNMTERVFEIGRSDLSELTMSPYTAAIVRNRVHFCGAGYSLIVNVHNGAITQAEMFDMDACAVHGSVLYWGNSTGLYSTTQGSVSAEFTFQANLPAVCRMRSVELTGEFSGSMALDMTSDENITKTYQFIPTGSNKQTSIHFPARRDNGKGKHWKYRFYNKSGSDFSVDQVRAKTINVPTNDGGYAN